jgi:hypothetical protein
MPPPASIANILEKSPLLNNEEVCRLFPTPADKDALLGLAKAVHDATEKNRSTAEAWSTLATFKDAAIVVLRKALGVPV